MYWLFTLLSHWNVMSLFDIKRMKSVSKCAPKNIFIGFVFIKLAIVIQILVIPVVTLFSWRWIWKPCRDMDTSKVLESTYKTTRCHVAGDYNLNITLKTSVNCMGFMYWDVECFLIIWHNHLLFWINYDIYIDHCSRSQWPHSLRHEPS
jgi:hypothetical protein